MTPDEFVQFRLRLDKTQEQLSQLLGVSVRAICSYEGGWRTVPPHVQRQLMFLVCRLMGRAAPKGPCWAELDCPRAQRRTCPAWEFRVGNMCWFVNGTHCDGAVQTSWDEKMDLCRECEMLEPVWRDAMAAKRLRPARGPARRS